MTHDKLIGALPLWATIQHLLVSMFAALVVSIAFHLIGVGDWLTGWFACTAYFVALDALRARGGSHG